MSNGFKLSTVLRAPPRDVYRAWLDPRTHEAFTGGGVATSSPRIGGAFTAWEGYIRGTYLALKPGERIVHAWRTTDFPMGAPDYQAGWTAFYFRPMKKYFQMAARPTATKRKATSRRPKVKAKAAKRRPAKGRAPSK